MKARSTDIPAKAEWVTLNQAAERLQLSWSTVRRMCADGRLDSRRFGRSIRIRRDSVEAVAEAA